LINFIADQRIFTLKDDFYLWQIGFMIERIGDELIFSYPGRGKAMAKYKPYD